MRWLCVQVQPGLSPGIDMEQVASTFAAVASTPGFVESHSVDHGEDQGSWSNFCFGTTHPLQLWETIQTKMSEDGPFAQHLRKSSIVVCTGENGWDDYLLLAHFDSEEKLDPASALESA